MSIRVEYAGLNFVDVLARRGVPGYFTRWPFVPGMEVGGTIHALGEGVDTFAAGDRVAAFTVDGTGLADVAVARAALTVPVPAGLDLATARRPSRSPGLPLSGSCVSRTSAQAIGAVADAASGGVGSAIGQLGCPGPCRPRDRRGAFPGQAATLAAAYTPVTQGENFVARARHTAGTRIDVVSNPSAAASWPRFWRAGGRRPGRVLRRRSRRTRSRATAGSGPENQEPDHHGINILNRARKAPPTALSLIQGVLTLTQDGLHIPAPAVVDWAEAIDAHIAQSEGRSRGKNSRTPVTRSPPTVRRTSRLCRVHRSVSSR